jgi:hypothetical protein
MAAKANSQPRQWAKPGFMVIRDRLWVHLGIGKRPVNWGRDRIAVVACGVDAGSVPHIYTKGATLNYFLVIRDWLGRGGRLFGIDAGSVPHIYTKGATINYFLVIKS